MSRPLTGEEAQRLYHELQVHQIELEMQNAELRQSRNEVEEALEKYTGLYDFAPVGYFTLTRDTGIVAVNLTGAGLLGSGRSRLIGRPFELFVAEESRASFTAFLGKVFAGQIKQTCEVALLKEGNNRLFVQIEALSDTPGNECRAAVIDITERRRAEDALAEKRRELEELNRTLKSRIVQAVVELREKDQMLILQDRRAVMGEMINNIAHQWRQPLNSLGLYIQELPLDISSGTFSAETAEIYVDKCMQLITHMSQTIDDFRSFFRSDKKIVPFGVAQVIRQTISMVEKSYLDQRIRISFATEGDPRVTGFPNEYAQVLLNILMNARDELVGRDVDDALISIHAAENGGKSIVTIADNAGGIAPEILDRLFDPYFTTKEPDKGTGVGLFMSQTIIEKNMGGRLTVRNTGNGAEFRIEV
ncbi:MAG: PAS domain-containing sensor histidine kinase [Deltaproteobacteria bacterium]|nr:PAS domain-containing sensor histidine kinase [Deltaproteobacteria bacterium]TLN05010.1 MAG: PAS domain S-box protein [bacterium]